MAWRRLVHHGIVIGIFSHPELILAIPPGLFILRRTHTLLAAPALALYCYQINSNMKNQLFSACLVLLATFSLIGQSDYRQYEVVRFKAKMGQHGDFEKALAAHNKKYHNTAPYKVGVFEIRTGPSSGEYELAMGPMTFTQMEGRPSGEEHEKDWQKVLEHVESIGEAIYWRADKDLVYQPAGSENYSAFRWRYGYVKPGQFDRFEKLIGQVIEVMKTRNHKASFQYYYRWGASQGPHVCTEMGMNSFSYYDTSPSWREEFEAVHGEGSMDMFSEELDLCIDRAKTYDELVKFLPALSSDF